MYLLFFTLGLVVIGVFALAAIGAFGELKADQSIESDADFATGQRIPIELFGYKKKRVNKIISDLETEIANLKTKKK